MSRVEENANVVKCMKQITGRDFDEINAKLLNDIRSTLLDISRSLAIIADAEHMKTLSAVSVSDSLTHSKEIINMRNNPSDIDVAKAAAKAIINYSQLFIETYENCSEEENSDG